MSIFTVTNTNDSGSGSLRQAILSANALTGKDLINFDGVFADKNADTITLNGNSLSITDDLSIQGTGASLLTVSGNNTSRVFEISSSISVDLVGLTVADGYYFFTNTGDGEDSLIGGGGIVNAGTLTVGNSIISDNSVQYQGAGIYNSGTLMVNNSTITNNTSGEYAGGGGIFNTGILTVSHSIINGNNGGHDRYGNGSGGIYNSGNATVINSTISNNSARFGGGIYNSGALAINNTTISSNSSEVASGIYNLAILTLNNSTISDNQSDGASGGIYNGGTLTVINSTISKNSAILGGGINNSGTTTISNSTISSNSGGIHNDGTLTLSNSTISSNPNRGIYNNGNLTASNSTITLNTVSNEDYPNGESGGAGIYNSNSGSATVKNSIIAGNTKITYGDKQTSSNSDVAGNFTSNGFNLVGILNDSTGFKVSEQLNVPITTIIDTTLKNNGSVTKTHALVTGSRAINGGKDADIPADTTDIDGDGNITEQVSFDQRGSGFKRISGSRVDIGAFEAVVNVINGTRSRDQIKGTAGNDIITGFQGEDILTGGAGADEFVYTKYRDAGDTITDLKVGTDKIILRPLFGSLGLGNLSYANAVDGGYLSFGSQGTDTVVFIDLDGSFGAGRRLKLVKVNKVSNTALNNAVNFAL
ncbi:beta strand repeat-containing protein [Nostoc sp. MG11]|uniref:beta strand repeat-containing protein n=1 Tax=Nostoc sp. MG11 TaxID=2721166 RepID=UPI0018690481|nr:choice-of-anchor Q domain-containing protein [Nostoc sp. MG11]